MKKKDIFSGSTLPNIFLICAAIFAVSMYFYKKNENKKYLQEQIQKVRERRAQQRNEKKLNNQGGVPVFPDDNNTNTQNNQEENNIDSESAFSTPEYNAWQCKNCGALSRSKKEPCCGEFGKCPNNNITNSYSPHSFIHANTNRGYQCNRCGIEAFTYNNNNGQPSGGDFGKCNSNSSHNWRAF